MDLVSLNVLFHFYGVHSDYSKSTVRKYFHVIFDATNIFYKWATKTNIIAREYCYYVCANRGADVLKLKDERGD
jgi:hypothetical protein